MELSKKNRHAELVSAYTPDIVYRFRIKFGMTVLSKLDFCDLYFYYRRNLQKNLLKIKNNSTFSIYFLDKSFSWSYI